MRSVRFSTSFREELARLLAQGVLRFGSLLVVEKRDLVIDTIQNFLVHHPRRPVDPELGICTYPVTDTPFVLLYDFDDEELRVHLVIHKSADRMLVDLSAVVW